MPAAINCHAHDNNVTGFALSSMPVAARGFPISYLYRHTHAANGSLETTGER